MHGHPTEHRPTLTPLHLRCPGDVGFTGRARCVLRTSMPDERALDRQLVLEILALREALDVVIEL